MIEVEQSKLYTSGSLFNGNCFSASLASILDIPLWMVPQFEDMYGLVGQDTWDVRVNLWLNKMFNLTLVKLEGHPNNLPEFYIATGMSNRGVLHSCVFSDGKLVHDPHYSKSGISNIIYIQYLEGTVCKT